MKKLLIVLVMCVSILGSTPSQAGMGIASGNILMILSGAASVWTSGVFRRPYKDSDAIGKLMRIVAAAVGLVMLDEGNQKSISFAPISAERAQEIGLNAAELEGFNSQVDEINAVAQSVEQELGRTSAPTVEQAKALWETYGAALSPEALSGVAKVSAAALN